MIESAQKYDCRVILTAGGNPTGIVVFPDDNNRSQYDVIARKYMSENPTIEQFGFLEGKSSFYMSGGEFCGNAARAAAWLVWQQTGKKQGNFTMSGFSGLVTYRILPNESVRCDFPGVQIQSRRVRLTNGLRGQLVDLGGIVHLVLNPEYQFLNNPAQYQAVHSQLVQELLLSERLAVGIIWQERGEQTVKIHPVVWVKDINSFFYETACGSGTLAVLEASGEKELFVTQPSGMQIQACKNGNVYSLISEVAEI